MRKVYVQTSADATVTEGWVVDVPDDLVVDETNALEILDSPEPFGCEVRSVENEGISDETDRSIILIEDV